LHKFSYSVSGLSNNLLLPVKVYVLSSNKQSGMKNLRVLPDSKQSNISFFVKKLVASIVTLFSFLIILVPSAFAQFKVASISLE